MRAAYEISSRDPTPDPELELEPGEDAQWGNHSARRFADRVTCENRVLDDLPPEMINYFYGWRLDEMSKEMMLHYAGLDRGGRLELAKCSMRI